MIKNKPYKKQSKSKPTNSTKTKTKHIIRLIQNKQNT